MCQLISDTWSFQLQNHGSNECQPLISCSTKLYKDLDMTMKQQVSLLWFGRKALNEAMERRTELKGKCFQTVLYQL